MGVVYGDVDPGVDDAVLQCRRRPLSRIQGKENEPAKNNGAMWYGACGYDVAYITKIGLNCNQV